MMQDISRQIRYTEDYLKRFGEAFFKTYSKPLPWLVILFGNPEQWYRKRLQKFISELKEEDILKQ